MAKIVSLHDAEGNVEHFDVSAIKARKLNQWSGWTCSAGTNSIHIDFDGNVWAGTCKVGGKLGDIFNGWTDVPDWIICTKHQCNCGTEIKLPKHMMGHGDILDEPMDPQGRINPGSVVGVNYTKRMELHVQWDLGRFCNFDCLYCLKPQIHNDFEEHKPLDVLINTVDKLHVWSRGQLMRFCFSGGEPTLHPGFIDLCEHIQSLGHKVHLTTNGSQGPGYWRKLVEVIDIASISVHFEFTKERNLVKTIAVALDKKLQDRYFGLEVKLMTKPEDWDRSMALRDELLDLPGFAENATLQIAPLRVMLGQHELMDYTDEQISQFGVVQH